jgi:hypothetical protein
MGISSQFPTNPQLGHCPAPANAFLYGNFLEVLAFGKSCLSIPTTTLVRLNRGQKILAGDWHVGYRLAEIHTLEARKFPIPCGFLT